MNILNVFVLLYVVSLHTSMAGMELFGSLLLVNALIGLYFKKVSFKTELQTPILVFTLVILVNLLITPATSPWTSRLSELTWIFTYWGVTKALEMVWSDKFEDRLFKVWLFCLSIATVFGLYQFLTGHDFIRSNTNHIPPSGDFYRAAGFFSLCLTYAYSMGISSLTLSLPSRKLNRSIPFVALVLGAACIFVSLTRGAWLAFAVTLTCLPIIFWKKMSRFQIAGLLSFLVAFALALTITKGGSNRLEGIGSGHRDQAITERFGLWKAYSQMFYDHPVFGVGFQQGADRLSEYYQRLEINQTIISHAHNDYIQALAETGIIGFAAFIFLLGSALWKTYQLRTHRLNWSIALLAGQIFILVGSLSQANFTDAEVNHFLVFNWALASMLAKLHKKSEVNLR